MEILRGLTTRGVAVDVVPTVNALRFVGEATFAALSGRPVATSVWQGVEDVRHVRLGKQADLVIVAPTTADLLARAVHGIADDLLTNVLLTARCPILMAPAMHTEMWQHRATQANVEALRERGVVVLNPASGRLTGMDSGPGRLPDPAEIVEAGMDLLRRAPIADLAGKRIVITAGGTQEAIDPVRYIGNHSSGLQGVALARTAISRGARVTLIAANMSAEPPAGVDLIRVASGAQMLEAVREAMSGADILVMAAAVADFRPSAVTDVKLKKSENPVAVSLELTQTTDILATMVSERSDVSPLIVGFAAETGDGENSILEFGRAKLARKGCDLLIVNDVSPGGAFGNPNNEVVILGRDGSEAAVACAPKAVIADAIWDAVIAVGSLDHIASR